MRSEVKLPSGWREMPLERLMVPRKDSVHPLDVPEAKYVGLEHLTPGNPDLTEWGDIGTVRSTKSKFSKGNVLYGKLRPYLDKAALAHFDGVCSTDILVFAPTEETSARYLSYLMHTGGVLQHAIDTMRGTNHPRTKWSSLAELSVPLPSLSEQRTISDTLETLSNALAVRERELETERERKASLLNQIFCQGTNGEAVKDSDAGTVPASWEVVTLGDLIESGPQNGLYKPQDCYGEGTPILRINDFDNAGCFVSPHLQEVQLDDGEVEKHGLRKRDIVINRVNSLSHLGKSALVTEAVAGAVFESNMMRIRLDEGGAVPEFVAGYLLSDRVRSYFRSRAKRAVAQSSINQSDVRSVPVPVPSEAERRLISTVIDACDEKITALASEVRLHRELFRALLEELMTGQRSVLPLTTIQPEITA